MNMTDIIARDRLADISKGRYNRQQVERMFAAAIKEGCLYTERTVFEYCALQFLQELHYEFGFGKTRLSRFLDGFAEKIEAFDAGAYDLDDMRTALKEDTGIELKIDWKDEV